MDTKLSGSASATLEHYGVDDHLGRVGEALAEAGLTGDRLDLADLAPLDQFHARGLEATEELASRLDLPDGAAFLDVGCGLGGPARYLASLGRWQVTGIDLNPAFIDVARMLTERTGLGERVAFQQADALELPFPGGCFDGAWTLQVAMNIQDRPRLYRGIRRVLKPGGWLAVYTVVAGSAPLIFPVPWARTPQTSFLPAPESLRAVLREAGFREVCWTDQRAEVLDWFDREASRRGPGAEPTLALKLVMGSEFPAMMANFRRNLEEGRAGLIQAILRRD